MNKKKLNIAIFHLAFFYSGGGEKLVLEEIKGLRERGHNVDCFSPVIEKDQCFPDILGGFKVKTFFKFPKIFKHQETIEILLTCILFPLIAKRFTKYDIVLGANQPGPWLSWLLAKIYKIPYIIYLAQPTRILYPREVDLENGVWVKRKSFSLPLLVKLFKPIFTLTDNISIKSARKVLVNGDYMAGVIKKVYKVKPIVCPAGAYAIDGVASKRWTGNVRANSHVVKKPYILLSNRHFPQKKFEYAIHSTSAILENGVKTSLIITGNCTRYTQELKMLAKKLKIDKNVIFTGYVTEKNLSKLYKNAAVYVYTSPEEDFGMGVIEAMGAGVPVVAWNNAGPSRTILNGKTGYLVKPYLQKKFTEKIIYLLKNENINNKMGNNARKHVSKNYTYQKHNDLLEKTIFTVVNR